MSFIAIIWNRFFEQLHFFRYEKNLYRSSDATVGSEHWIRKLMQRNGIHFF